LAVSLHASGLGFAVGANSTIFKTTDAGATWWVLFIDWPIFFLRGVSIVDAKTAIVVGFDNHLGGVVLRTADAGETWRLQSGLSDLRAVSFVNGNTGFIVGGLILRTDDGGDTWARQFTGIDYVLYGVSFANADSGIAVGGSGLGIILRTVDGGATWTGQNSHSANDLLSVSMASPEVATVVGVDGTILRTTTGGEDVLSVPAR
jgi:photosystem II stability/assembly factor-like uncharacterized protein